MNLTFASLIKLLRQMPNTAPVRFAENGEDNSQRDLYFFALENGTVFLTSEERSRPSRGELIAHLIMGGSFDLVNFELMGTGQELEIEETFLNGDAYHIILKEAA